MSNKTALNLSFIANYLFSLLSASTSDKVRASVVNYTFDCLSKDIMSLRKLKRTFLSRSIKD